MVEYQTKPIVLVTGGTGMVGRNIADLVTHYQKSYLAMQSVPREPTTNGLS